MSDLTVRFGSGLSPQQWYLPGTPIALLPHRPTGDHPPAEDALRSETFAPAWSQQLLFGDHVLADTTAGGLHLFEVAGSWNSVKNAAASSPAAEDLRFDGFVQVDATVGSASDAASHLDLIGAKRGNIVTGAGDDAIRIAFSTNAASASNAFRVHSGDGNDRVTIAGLDVAAKMAAGDPTYHSGLQADGAATTAFVDLGAGNDSVSGGAARDLVHAGAGNDLIDAGLGNDTIEAGAGDDVLIGGPGRDILTGGEGNDIFRFASLAEISVTSSSDNGSSFSILGGERITDFAFGDLIDLSAIPALTFIGEGRSSGTPGEMWISRGPTETTLAIAGNNLGFVDAGLTLNGSMSLEETAPGSHIFQLVYGLL